MWMSYSNYHECFEKLTGELGTENVHRDHQFRRRPVEHWSRWDIEAYLDLRYFDHDFEENCLNAMVTGALDPRTFEYRKGDDSKEKPVSWTQCFHTFPDTLTPASAMSQASMQNSK